MDRIIVAFEGSKSCLKVKELIEGSGEAQCLACISAGQVKRTVARQHVGAIVCGYKFAECTAEELFHDLPDYCAMLMMAQQDVLELIEEPDIFKLRLPASKSEILASVRLLIQVESRLERLRRPRRSRQEVETIDAAKAYLMESRGFSEEQAHRYLQRLSMDTGMALSRAARSVLEGTFGKT